METYYVAELQNEHSYREAFVIKAQSRSHAKKLATKAQTFYGTILEIGLSVNESGFITHPVCRKVGGVWTDLD